MGVLLPTPSSRALTPSTNGGRSLVQSRPTSSSSLLTSMNSPFDFYPDQHSSLSRSRPDTAPLTYLNVDAMSPIFEHGVGMGLTESSTSSIGHLKCESSFPSRHPQPPSVAGLPLLHERSVRPPVAASKLGLPYLEEQGKLLKRNHALERALRRMNEELTRLRGIKQAGAADAERAQQELCARYEAALAAKELEAERHRFEAEAECERQREAMSAQIAEEVRVALDRQLLELSGSAKERAAAREKQAKEQGLERLQRQVGRRILNQGLANGWAAWHAFWLAKLLALEKLRQTGRRLRSGVLVGTFEKWAAVAAEARHDAKHAADLEGRELQLREQAMQLEAKLAEMRQACRLQLQAAEEAKRLALERQRIELLGTAQEQAAMREEQAREARIERLQRQVGRRILNQGLANGWAAWHDMWRARVLAMERLQWVSNRLRTPALESAFGYWGARSADAKQRLTLSAQQAREASLELERQRLVGELCLVRAEADRRVAAMQAERLALLERIAQLTGGHAEAQSLLEAQEAAGREERVELLRRQSARRMLHRDLVLGWNAWLEAYEARRYAHGRLRAVSHRLHSPELSRAFEHWRLDAAIAKRHAMMTTHQKTERALRAELATLQSSHEQQLAAAEESKRLALERQHVELTGTAAERAALAQQKDREARVAGLTRTIGRRMLHQGLVDGWTAWVALWEARRSSLRQLHVAGNRLRAPELSNAFSFWARDASDTRRVEELARMEKESRSMEMQLRRARFEAGQLEMVRVAREDELEITPLIASLIRCA